MGAREISATEFARNLSSLPNEVRYQGISLDVRRGRELVARVVPPPDAAGFPVDRLNELFANLPHPGRSDAESFFGDLQRLDDLLVPATDPSDS